MKPKQTLYKFFLETFGPITLFFIFLTIFLLSGKPLLACPSYIFGEELSVLLKMPREKIHLFVLNSPAKDSWEKIPLQIDPINDDGRLTFFPSSVNWKKDLIGKNDRLSLDPRFFGRSITKEDSPPCLGELIYEIFDSSQPLNRAYFAFCSADPKSSKLALLKKTTPYFNVDIAQKKLASETYDYFFSPNNHMLFNNIIFRYPAPNPDKTVAHGSDMLIRADVKNFFSMNFRSNDIESDLGEHRQGDLGLIANVTFFLKILFFRINLNLSTDVSFFSDSANIPMMVTIPVDATKYLLPKSGILYSWVLSPEVQPVEAKNKIPALDESIVKKGYKELAKVGMANCSADFCYYQLFFSLNKKTLAMNFTIPKYMVEKGFFPLFVNILSKYSESMNWPILKNTEERMGLYFETSGLTEGHHPWDFWLILGENKTEVGNRDCPKPLTIRKMPK